jgi:RHS repeat-associated protein
MSISSLKILCRYVYDPLDRLTGVGLVETVSTQRFYQENQLITELGQQTQRTIFRHQTRPLAQRQSEAGVFETTLLATDLANSLLQTVSGTSSQRLSYTAYGYHPAESGLSRLLGFNGECPDAITGHYLLGQGTRAFNPVLMRFNNPDNFSPFDEGGINCYAYCKGDAVNFNDPTANVRIKIQVPTHIIKKTSVIKTNPQYKVNQSSSTIAQSGSSTRNPSMDSSTNRNRSQATPNTSELISMEPFPYELPATKTNMPKPSAPTSHSKLLEDAITYDRHKAHTPGFEAMAKPELRAKWELNHKLLQNADERTTPRTKINKLRINLRNSVLQVKQSSIRYHELHFPTK